MPWNNENDWLRFSLLPYLNFLSRRVCLPRSKTRKRNINDNMCEVELIWTSSHIFWSEMSKKYDENYFRFHDELHLIVAYFYTSISSVLMRMKTKHDDDEDGGRRWRENKLKSLWVLAFSGRIKLSLLFISQKSNKEKICGKINKKKKIDWFSLAEKLSFSVRPFWWSILIFRSDARQRN